MRGGRRKEEKICEERRGESGDERAVGDEY